MTEPFDETPAPPFEDNDEEMIGPMDISPPDFTGLGPVGRGVLERDAQKKTAQIEDLMGWSEKFEYQPGVQYVRISRAYPKVWEGVPIAGVMEDVCEPIDTDYLMEKWGGGTYKLSAIQLDADGKSRTVDRKTVTISGLPYAFRGQDGNAHPLPESQHLRSEMRYRRDDEEGIDEGFRSGERVTAADLYNIAASQNQRGGTDPETLDVLRNAQNDVQNHMQRAMDSQARLHENTISAQREEMKMMRDRISDQQSQAQAPFQHAMSMMENRGTIEMQMMQSQLDAMRGEHTNQMQMMQNEHSRVIDSLQREADRMRDDARSREENIRSSVSGQYQGQIAALEHRVQMAEQTSTTQVLMARQDADRREAQLKMLLEANHTTQFTMVASERDRLASDLSSTKEELTSYRQIVMEKQDPIASMERMQGLIGAVQSFTGGGAESAAEAPADFLGKIAHYGPGLAKNFLGPILSRVDNATAIAKQAVEIQQAQQGDQPQYFNQMPQQRPAPGSMPPGYAPSQMPPPYTPPPGMPDLPSYGANASPEPEPTSDPLVRFLENQLKANTQASTAVDLLDGAIGRGEISQESIIEFMNAEDHDVVKNLSERAMADGFTSLPTPRGRHFMEAILNEIRERVNAAK